MMRKLLQWQALSNQQLDNIVRHETEYWFKKKIKIKECLNCSRVSPQQLKDEMQSFFLSRYLKDWMVLE
jgi:hypothetical protein